MKKTLVGPGDRILFQGDSITDAGRSSSADGLGGGYVAMVRGMISALHPDLDVEIVNRGVSGDRTAELLARWQKDCLDLKPQVLSIKIGVNDVWRLSGEWNGQKHIPLPDYRANLRRLIDSALAGGVRQLVLVSPTTITPENASPMNDLLGQYDAVVREFAQQCGAVHVPARDALMTARSRLPKTVWTTDGCHPSAAGHALIASCWLAAVGLA